MNIFCMLISMIEVGNTSLSFDNCLQFEIAASMWVLAKFIVSSSILIFTV